MSYTIHQVNFNGMDVSTEALIEMLRGYVEDKDLTTITNKITELTTALETKASTGHKHEQSDINNLGQALAGKLDVGQHDYSDIISNTNAIPQLDNVNIDNLSIDSKYSVYTDNNEQLIIKKGNTEIAHYNTTTSKWVLSFDIPQHTHEMTDILYLQNAFNLKAGEHHTHYTFNHDLTINGDLIVGNTNIIPAINGKADSIHTHTTSDITDLSTTLSNYASSSHTHTSFNNKMTFTAPSSEQGNVLTIYGNYKYSRFNVAKDSNSGMAVYGFNGDNANDPCCYIKMYNQSCELEVHNNKVKVIGDLEVSGTINGQSQTITHRAPITESIENYQLGYPVFAHDVNGNVSPINCIPSVKSTGTYREYLGIIVGINEAQTITRDMEVETVETIPASIEFATHGDYLFHVNNSSNYHIGDILTYDGNIIADDTFINSKIMTSIVGKVMSIVDEHTLAMFKQ